MRFLIQKAGTIHPTWGWPMRDPFESSEQFFLPKWAELIVGAPRNYVTDVEIFGEGEPAQYLYKIVEGAARTFNVLSDGRRQIAGFYLSGEFFGLGNGIEHILSAEAITNSKIL